MSRVRAFVQDAWSLSAGPIRRADPLLMGAAIAYNGLFALVPLALAFTAALTFLDPTDLAIRDLIANLEANLPDLTGSFLSELIEESYTWISDQRGVILLISIVLALWSGSRAVYAVQKALRTAQGVEDDRGYVVSRALGIAVTIAAGLAVIVAYGAFLVGNRFWEGLAKALGIGSVDAVSAFGIGLIVGVVWLVLWAIYYWGPPDPISYAGIVAAGVAALLVVGTIVAIEIVPDVSTGTALFGAIGVFLIWLYYAGIVIVAAPALFAGVVGAVRKQGAG